MGRKIGGKDMKPLAVWLQKEDHRKLTYIAGMKGVSRAEFVRRCLLKEIPEGLFVPACCVTKPDGKLRGCQGVVIFECYCDRCRSEPEMCRFYTCMGHMEELSADHLRALGMDAVWKLPHGAVDIARESI